MAWKRSRFSVLSPSILKRLISAESKKKIKNLLKRKIKQSFRGNLLLWSVFFVKRPIQEFTNNVFKFHERTEEVKASKLRVLIFRSSRIHEKNNFKQIHEQKAKKTVSVVLLGNLLYVVSTFLLLFYH